MAAAAGQGQQGQPAPRPSAPSGTKPPKKEWISGMFGLALAALGEFNAWWACTHSRPDWVVASCMFWAIVGIGNALISWFVCEL